MMDEHKTITDEEVSKWLSSGYFVSPGDMLISRWKEILTGEYILEEARQDILSFRKVKNDG